MRTRTQHPVIRKAGTPFTSGIGQEDGRVMSDSFGQLGRPVFTTPEPITVDPPPPAPAPLAVAFSDVTFLHWCYEPDEVRPLLLPGTDPDSCDGSAYVGLVAFRIAPPASSSSSMSAPTASTSAVGVGSCSSRWRQTGCRGCWPLEPLICRTGGRG